MHTPESAAKALRSIIDKLDEIDKDYKAAKKPLQEAKEKIETWFKVRAEKEGVNGWNTDYGTIFFSTQDRCSIADFDEVLAFVREHELYELLTKGVAKKAVREYLDATGVLPPGLNFSTARVVNFRKPRAKAK